MTHVCERDLRGIQVLKRRVALLERGLEEVGLHLHDARSVAVECVRLSVHVHLLQLRLVFPAAVLDSQAHVRRIAARRVGEDSRCGIAHRDAKLLSLLQGVLADEVHLSWLVSLGCHLDGAIQECHLVDKQVSEHSRAVHHDVNSWSSKLLQGDETQFVDTTEVVGKRLHTNQGQNLCQRFPVRLDVVRSPQNQGYGFRVLVVVLRPQTQNQFLNDRLRRADGCRCRDALWIERVHVLPGRQHIWISHRISTGAWEDISAL
mmetsp:Transcript_9371/g.28235  ORF Transcript_9371/g.28235 Transcript_9371/m.28235 type:complete len:261 (-) Transcript_9371:3104-3886(-)